VKDIIDHLRRWQAAGVAAATVRLVAVSGSGPRQAGASMAVSAHGEVIGSVSGGCVESAVVLEASEVLETGIARLVQFSSSDDAFAVGLTCGGTVDLFIEPLSEWTILERLAATWNGGPPVALATVIAGDNVGAKLLMDTAGQTDGTLGDAKVDRTVARDASGELASGSTAVRHYTACGDARAQDVTVFVETFAPPPKLLIFGAVDFTDALARMAKVLGFWVIVCDARATFATSQRFPMADEVVVDWPHRLLGRMAVDLGPDDAVCVLTHDEKFDVPAIAAALATDVGYVGAMGSRRTNNRRLERLCHEGVPDVDLARLMAPIGLDLGARTPAETAVSICAEIVAARTGRKVPSLRDSTGPIH